MRPAALGFLYAVTLLVDVLAFQAELGAGTDIVVQNIEEMAVLCQEHLILQWMRPIVTPLAQSFSLQVVRSKITFYLWVPDQPLDQVIECLRLARTHKLELRDALLAYVSCLYLPYDHFTDGHFEEAAPVLDWMK